MPTRFLAGSCAVLVLALAATAEAAPRRISIAPIHGPHEPALESQLSSALCGDHHCVPASRVLTLGKLDAEKARRQSLSAMLFPVTRDDGGKRVLWITVRTQDGASMQRWRFVVGPDGTLGRRSLTWLANDLDRVLAAPRRAPAAPPEAPPRAAPAPAPSAPAPAAPSAELGPQRATPTAPAPWPPPASAEAGESAEFTRTQPLVAVEAGAYLTHRDLGYEGAAPGSAPLRNYRVGLVTSPALRVEVYPASAFTDGAVAGLGAFGAYSFSLGLKTRTESTQSDASLTRLDAGLLWRFRELTALRLDLIPSVSYRLLKLTASPAIPGLPDARLSGVRAGLLVEVPVHPVVSLVAGGGYVRWLAAKDLVKGDVPFFPGGSAYALEAEAGLSVALAAPLSLRAIGEYSSTRYSLDRDTSGQYVATGARDAYAGGRIALRYRY
jgi:hypothetical protein